MVIVEKPFRLDYVPLGATDPDPGSITPPTNPGTLGTTLVVGSFDPNDKVTVGAGEAGNIEVDDTILYTIFFENDPEFASAPAQRVTITDTLDAHLDLASSRAETPFSSPLKYTPRCAAKPSAAIERRVGYTRRGIAWRTREPRRSCEPWVSCLQLAAVTYFCARSKRSRFITFSHAATKSWTNFSFASALA